MNIKVQEIKNIIFSSGRIKNLLIVIIKLIIAAGLIIFLINKLNPSEILNSIKKADILILNIAVLFTIPNIYLQYFKWKITCNVILKEKKKSKIIYSLFYGLSAGAFTPVRIGEYFGRAIVFKDKPILQVGIATFIDKFFLLVLVAFIGALGSILFIHFYFNTVYYITVALFIVVFTIFYLLILLLMNQRFWDNFLFNRLRESKKFYPYLKKLNVLKNLDKSYLFKMGFTSFFLYLIIILQFGLLTFAFSGVADLSIYFWAGILVMFVKTIIPPVTLGELGIREGAAVYFLTILTGSGTAGFNASIFLFLINILVPAVIGFFLLFRRNYD